MLNIKISNYIFLGVRINTTNINASSYRYRNWLYYSSWWRLLKKRVVRTKLNIYLVIMVISRINIVQIYFEFKIFSHLCFQLQVLSKLRSVISRPYEYLDDNATVRYLFHREYYYVCCKLPFRLSDTIEIIIKQFTYMDIIVVSCLTK